MMLSEETAVPEAALPLDELRAHLRLGTGFADLQAADAVLISYLRAAIAAVEGRTTKALLARDYRLELAAWRGDGDQPLPVAPVSAVSEVLLRDAAGAEVVVPAAGYRLVPDLGRPRLEALSGALPVIGQGGVAVVRFTAGFGPDWADVPVDLAQAVLMLAAQFYETRHEGAAASAGSLPFGVLALIERWRTVRVLGGRGA